MSEPDEALLRARERALEYVNPAIRDDVVNGLLDHVFGIPEWSDGYRAGAAASAERIKALEARLAELKGEVTGLTVDLCQLLDVVTNDGHDGSHLEDDDGGQSECEVCAVMAGIRALLKAPDQ